jgi:1-acyl-sn-glycerol-3-phosphate acyltransferase
MRELLRNIRAARRATVLVALTPGILALTALQHFVVQKMFKNSTAIPKLLFRIGRRAMGIKVEFNQASAPLIKDKPVLFVTNHTYGNDYIPIGGLLDGAFIGKIEMRKVPLLGKIADSMNFIGIHRSRKDNARSRGKIIAHLNRGKGAVLFAEGTVGNGEEINRFHAALFGVPLGEPGLDEKNEPISLKQDVPVQSVSMRLKSLDGKDVSKDAAARIAYRNPTETKPLRVLWSKLKYRKTVFEMRAFEPLQPADYKDGERTQRMKDIANKATAEIASEVNPDQTRFEPARIPGSKSATPAPA